MMFNIKNFQVQGEFQGKKSIIKSTKFFIDAQNKKNSGVFLGKIQEMLLPSELDKIINKFEVKLRG